MRHFAEQGYHETSIDDIADDFFMHGHETHTAPGIGGRVLSLER